MQRPLTQTHIARGFSLQQWQPAGSAHLALTHRQQTEHIRGAGQTFDEDADVGAGEGGVGVVADGQQPVGVDEEQRRLRERPVRLTLVPVTPKSQR